MQSNVNETSANPPQWQVEEVHLQDYLLILHRHRRLAMLVFLLVVAVVAAYTFMVRPVYEAEATLHVRDSKLKGGGLLGELGMTQENPIATEIEILKSRTNAEEVVKRLHLNWQVDKRKGDPSFGLVEFSSPDENPEYRVRLTGGEGFLVEDAHGRKVASGRSGELVRGAGLSLLLKDLHGEAGASFRLTLVDFNLRVRQLREAIRAREVGKRTNVVRLSYQDKDPRRASEVVNTLTQVYLERAISLKSEEARKSVEFIESQLDEVRGYLDSAEQRLEKFKSRSGLIQLDSEAKTLVEQLARTEQESNLLRLRQRQVEFAIESLKGAINRGEVYAPSVLMDDPVVAALAERLAELEVEQRGLLSEVTASHPLALKLRKQIDGLERKMLATFVAAREALEVQVGTLRKQLAEGEAKLQALPKTEQELARLTRLATVNAGIYTFLLEKNQEARIAQAATVSNINVVDPAIVPDQPVKPKKKKNLLLGGILGAMLGIGLAFFRDYLDDSIKESDSASRLLGLPVLSSIPLIDLRKGAPLTTEEGKKKRVLISHFEPRSPAAEAFRSLRTSIHFAGGKGQNQVLLMTSSLPGEGKTTLSANLALTLSQTGKRVLLVGCDLRKPTLHTMFEFPSAPGLTELLIGDCQVSDAGHHTGHYRLDVVNAGTTPPNPAELLGSSEMRTLVEDWRKEYDFILLDAPPVLAVTDASVLTSLVDRVLTVVEAGGIKIKAAQRMVELLRSVDAPLAGLVFNDKTGKGASYYGYYGKRYGGNYVYGEEYRQSARRGLWGRLFGRRKR